MGNIIVMVSAYVLHRGGSRWCSTGILIVLATNIPTSVPYRCALWGEKQKIIWWLLTLRGCAHTGSFYAKKTESIHLLTYQCPTYIVRIFPRVRLIWYEWLPSNVMGIHRPSPINAIEKTEYTSFLNRMFWSTEAGILRSHAAKMDGEQLISSMSPPTNVLYFGR